MLGYLVILAGLAVAGFAAHQVFPDVAEFVYQLLSGNISFSNLAPLACGKNTC